MHIDYRHSTLLVISDSTPPTQHAKMSAHVENNPECPHCLYPSKALKISGLFFSGLAAGGTLLTTLYVRPVFQKLPTNEAYNVFDLIYGVGKVTFPILSLLGTASFAGASYIERHPKGSYNQPQKARSWYNPSSSRLLAYSAASLIAIVPYTLIVMKPTLDKLFAVRLVGAKGQNVKDLLSLWAAHHVVRVILTLLGFTGGIIATTVL